MQMLSDISLHWLFCLLTVRAVSSLKPNVEIEPLPKAILQVFNYREHQEKDSIPQADLSKVDSVLVNTLMPFQREGVKWVVNGL